jgi:hypothetical protein
MNGMQQFSMCGQSLLKKCLRDKTRHITLLVGMLELQVKAVDETHLRRWFESACPLKDVFQKITQTDTNIIFVWSVPQFGGLADRRFAWAAANVGSSKVFRMLVEGACQV